MPIFAKSRYEGVDITGIRQPDKTIKSFLHNRVLIDQDEIGNDFNIITVRAKEDLDLLAFLISGKSRLGWVIADLNEIDDPNEPIQAGTKLKVPSELFFADK